MNPVRIGVIGCGVIGRRHIEAAAAASHIDLVAIADLRTEIAQALATQFHVPTVYATAEALLADSAIDAVVLAMPAHLRTALALQAFASGKHVLTEKPVAMNAKEVQQMIAARGALVAACCSSRYHFLQATRVATDFVASGALGALRLVRCRAINTAGTAPQQPPPLWRLNRALNGGGILMNWGCYDLDYLLGVTGWSLQPQTVFAQQWSVPAKLAHYAAPDSDAETHVTTLIRCAGDIAISYERAEFVAAPAEASWEIIGAEGSLRLQMTPKPDGVHLYLQADSRLGTLSATLCRANEDHASVHRGPICDFATAIQTGSMPQTTLERSLVIQQLTDAIYQSTALGEAVTL